MIRSYQCNNVYRQIVVIVILVFAVGCTQSRSTGAVTKDPFVTNGHHAAINEMVSIGSIWKIQLTAIKSNSGVNDEKPGGGNVYVICSMNFTNATSQPQDLYTVTAFTLQDAAKQRYTPITLSFAQSPDGTIAAHATASGDIPFEVPASQSQFTLDFSTNDGQGFWDVTIPNS